MSAGKRVAETVGVGAWCAARTLLAVCILLLAACTERTQEVPEQPAAATRTTAQPADPTMFAYADVPIAELQRRMQSGALSARALTQAYLDRIATIDDSGPRLNAVIEINPDALAEADARDAERKAGRTRGPLHGVPVLLKDNIDATPMVNSAGSLALAGHRPRTDAPLVAKLREAGAVILGKTNLSEWANFRSSRSTSGWSGRGGQTKNPYALDRNPCGSSSGTGSAIAASLAAVGVGTETDGSIICPSAVAGLVGIKPTVGLVSRNGIVPISHTQDTAGPMARSVADAAVLLGAMTGVDADDAATATSADHALGDYTPHLKAGALKGARIGLLREAAEGLPPDVKAALERAVATMKAAGAAVVDAEIATDGDWDDAEFEVLLYEFKHGLEAYLDRSGAPVRTLAALIEFNARNAGREMPWFGQELFEQANAKGPLSDKAYRDAVEKSKRLAGPEGIDAALAKHRLDALLAPAVSPAWMTDPVNGDHFLGSGYGAAAVAGYPSITVPMGDSHGLPVGLVFMGAAWNEPRLIGLAYAYEQLSKARRPPRYLPTIIAAKQDRHPGESRDPF